MQRSLQVHGPRVLLSAIVIENSRHEYRVEGWTNPILEEISGERIRRVHLGLWGAFDRGFHGRIVLDIYDTKRLCAKG